MAEALEWNDTKSSPSFTDFLELCGRGLGHSGELIEINTIPWITGYRVREGLRSFPILSTEAYFPLS
jgi:hypothetical protein